MLALVRREGQSFMVGEAVIKIFQIHKDHVHLAVEAPRGIPIVRDDVKKRPIKEFIGKDPDSRCRYCGGHHTREEHYENSTRR